MLYTIVIVTLLATLGGVIFRYKKKLILLEDQFERERAEIRRDAKKRSGAVQ